MGDFAGYFGQTGDVPVMGAVNVNGFADTGVFCEGYWHVDVNGNGAWDPGTDFEGYFGQVGDIPVICERVQ